VTDYQDKFRAENLIGKTLNVEQRQEFDRQVYRIAHKAVRLFKQVPPIYVNQGGILKVCNNWDLFVSKVKSAGQETLDHDFSLACSLIKYVLNQLPKAHREHLLLTFKNYLQNESNEPREDSSEGSMEGLISYILDDVVELANSSRSIQPVRTFRWIGDYNNRNRYGQILIPGSIHPPYWQSLHDDDDHDAPETTKPLTLRDEYRQTYIKTWAKVDKSIRRVQVDEDGLPPLITMAHEAAETELQMQQVVTFIQALVAESAGGQKANSKLPALQETFDRGDPGLFFPFARKQLLTQDQVGPFLQQVVSSLTTLCPGRQVQIEELMIAIVRRIMGDHDAVFPVMHGPAGTGKTYLVQLLADAFTEAGVRTSCIMQPMTQAGGHSQSNNEIAMTIQGTSSRWGDARYGLLYREAFREDVDLVIVVLDEVDKCSLWDYLVTLLDPRQPLQDSFVREYVPSIDMRHKCLFVLSANNLEQISQGGGSPLWSRLTPIEMPAYTVDEVCRLVSQLVLQREGDGDIALEQNVLTLTREIVAKYDIHKLPSFRTLLDRVRRQLFVRRFPFITGVDDTDKLGMQKSRGIGFMCK